ncbi:GGDEF domain-containing response regulator [Solimicrobium silvestre]|uniref:diguanylate cyclase n=1 Tax=Solimicrobium silvestre TaxID=2099400 RepID=A0A2S9H4L8_9BURK|nr:diguanylate cyclase [Solimicrobium silvestre]PRC94930.1 GGDEF: diguanylate cyclase (GGDEF) domain [Solimicrobium silvestre]
MTTDSPIEEPCSILIIDDSPTAVRMLADMLKDLGHITFATNGEAGLKFAQEIQPQLILLDVEMPSMNGYEVCQRLKANPTTSESAVIFVTSDSTMESEIKALEMGAVDFITKPLNQPVVRARVRTQLKLSQQAAALSRLVNRDELTGLYNRRYFNEVIESEFQRLRRQELSLGLAFIDIDHFKKFNDRYGHQEGDRCLQKVASSLNNATLRSGELVARYGGEEFVAVLPHISIDQVAIYGEKLCKAISDCGIIHQDSEFGIVTISVGVTAAIPTSTISVHQLIKETDKALYASKSTGRNRCTTWAHSELNNNST